MVSPQNKTDEKTLYFVCALIWGLTAIVWFISLLFNMSLFDLFLSAASAWICSCFIMMAIDPSRH